MIKPKEDFRRKKIPKKIPVKKFRGLLEKIKAYIPNDFKLAQSAREMADEILEQTDADHFTAGIDMARLTEKVKGLLKELSHWKTGQAFEVKYALRIMFNLNTQNTKIPR
jgi:hypothetical protein